MVTTANTKDIYNWLSEIPDPEIPVITIHDLGILRDIKEDHGTYVVNITPTYTACPAIPLIETQIKEKMSEHGLNNVRVNITYTPAWTSDWLSEDAKKKMKQYGIAPPPHTSCVKVLKDLTKVSCPLCNSPSTELISRFGSTACKAMYKCKSCKEPFEHFKCH